MPVNEEEYLLIKAMEECVELAQRISKAICFGMQERQPGLTNGKNHMTNRERIIEEFNDLVATMEMAGFPLQVIDGHKLDAKVQKVNKYAQYSRELGRLVD